MTPEEFKAIGEAACVSVAASHDAVWTGNRLEPALWEAFRVELQRRFRRSTGEEQAVLSVDLTPAAPTDHVVGSRTAELEAALKLAIEHIEHMAAFIGPKGLGYSFESLGEDMPGMKVALSAPEAK